MSTPYDRLTLYNLEGDGDFTFRLFPSSIETSARANWQAQDVTTGTQTLFYANRVPRRLRLNEFLLDGSSENESIALDIVLLFGLMEEIPRLGRPPILLAQWGGRQERCVLEEVTITEQFFLTDGTPIRAKVNMALLEVREDDADRARRDAALRALDEPDATSSTPNPFDGGSGAGLPPR